jgi:hypothetical protein
VSQTKKFIVKKIDTLLFAAAGTGSLQHGSEACALYGAFGDTIKNDKSVPKLSA